MGLLDDLRTALQKIRPAVTTSTNAPAPNITAIPGLGQLEVVDTNQNPTMANIPGSWSRSWLGPGQPFTAGDISARDKDREMEPRTFQYVSGANSTISPRMAYGLTPFADLRFYAETVPEVSMCLRILTEEMKAFIPTIIDSNKGSAVADPDTALEWMTERPDGYNPWPIWLSRFLYNVLVYDAGCSYWMRNSRGKVTGARVIDGSTIFVLVDERGEQPRPPAPAFQQVIWGTPRMFLNTRQLWYKPRHLRTDAPYGRSPIEDSLPAVLMLNQLWDYECQKYIVGNIPEMVLTAPENWKDNADKVLEYEEAFNARMSGNNKERARARIVPNGMEVLNTKELSFNKESYDAATNSVRMSFGILQSEVGDAPGGGLGGSGYAEAMQSAFYRMGLAPLISYVESHFNDIIKENRIEGREFKLEFPPDSIDPTKEEEKYSMRFQIGGITRDEYREGIKMTKIGGDEGAFMVTPGGSPGGEEGDPFGGMGGSDPSDPSGGLSGMVNVGNKNTVQVRRPVHVGRSPVRVTRRPVSVFKVDSGLQSLAQQVDFNGDMAQFAIGFKEEQEHAETVDGDDVLIAQIAADHLEEDPEYYTKLRQVMEKYDRSELTKYTGVCAEDDMYYGAVIQIRESVEMPSQGANESLIVAIGNENQHARPAVWKPETGEQEKLQNWIGGKLFARAEAAYLLDRELAENEDAYLVPVTYTAQIDGVNGSIQHYLIGRQPKADLSSYGYSWLERAAVLDYIMGQLDRENKNWLTHPTDERRPVLIDSDLSFPAGDENHPIKSSFVSELSGKQLSKDMLDSIYLLLGNRDLWDDLRDVLDSDKAVEGAKARAKEIYEAQCIPNVIRVSGFDATSGVDTILVKTEFEESKHPRDSKGQFAPKGTSSGGTAPKGTSSGGNAPKAKSAPKAKPVVNAERNHLHLNSIERRNEFRWAKRQLEVTADRIADISNITHLEIYGAYTTRKIQKNDKLQILLHINGPISAEQKSAETQMNALNSSGGQKLGNVEYKFVDDTDPDDIKLINKIRRDNRVNGFGATSIHKVMIKGGSSGFVNIYDAGNTPDTVGGTQGVEAQRLRAKAAAMGKKLKRDAEALTASVQAAPAAPVAPAAPAAPAAKAPKQKKQPKAPLPHVDTAEAVDIEDKYVVKAFNRIHKSIVQKNWLLYSRAALRDAALNVELAHPGKERIARFDDYLQEFARAAVGYPSLQQHLQRIINRKNYLVQHDIKQRAMQLAGIQPKAKAPGAPGAPGARWDSYDPTTHVNVLANNPITARNGFGNGNHANDVYKIKLKDDGAANLKPVTNRGMYGTPQTEVFGFEAMSAMGFGDVVPITTYRTTPSLGLCSTQVWVEGGILGKDYSRHNNPPTAETKKSMSKMLVADMVLGNRDRNMGNWMFDPATGKVVAQDNGLMMLEGPRDDTYNFVTRCAISHSKDVYYYITGNNTLPEVFKADVDAAETYINSPEYETLLRKHFDDSYVQSYIKGVTTDEYIDRCKRMSAEGLAALRSNFTII